ALQGRRHRGRARVGPVSELHRLRAGAPLHEEPRGRSAAAPRRDASLQRAREPRAASVAGPTGPAPVSGGAAQPRASVVMVVHDGAATTRACLESLRATDEPFALVVVDNGSTDDTPRLFRDLASPWPLRYARNESNASVLAAYNQAWRLAATEVVCLLHNDKIGRASCRASR